MEANAGEYIKNDLHLKRFPRISLHCKLVPVQYWEHECGLLGSLCFDFTWDFLTFIKIMLLSRELSSWAEMEVLRRIVMADWRLDYLTGSHLGGLGYCHFKSKLQLLLKVNFSFLFLRCHRSENTSTNSVRKYCVELCGVKFMLF